MAIDIRVTLRGSLTSPGAGGVTSTGAASQTKTVVVGDMNITSYTSGGEPVTAANLGLKNLDCLLLSVVTVDSAVASVGPNVIHKANYDYTNELVLAWDGTTFADVPNTSARLRFAAFGDAADAPEFT